MSRQRRVNTVTHSNGWGVEVVAGYRRRSSTSEALINVGSDPDRTELSSYVFRLVAQQMKLPERIREMNGTCQGSPSGGLASMMIVGYRADKKHEISIPKKLELTGTAAVSQILLEQHQQNVRSVRNGTRAAYHTFIQELKSFFNMVHGNAVAGKGSRVSVRYRSSKLEVPE